MSGILLEEDFLSIRFGVNVGVLLSSVEEMLNGYLVLFVLFCRGKYLFFKLYMCFFGDVNFYK